MSKNRFLTASLAATLLLAPLAAISFAGSGRDAGHSVETVDLAIGSFEYPVPGEFLAGGLPVEAPLVQRQLPRRIAFMKYQVTQADYLRCVEAGACKAADGRMAAEPANAPVTGVNYLDAQAYAAWLSRESGQNWRLPTDAEWAYAAAERFGGESFSAVASDPRNPAIAWIRRYEEEAAARREPDPVAHPLGHFGPNTRGIQDMAGNVWEWTSTCYERATLDFETREITHRTENCRVHIAEGRHRAYMSDFVRDGVSGGCAVGTPPDNLGFRLVRDADRSIPGRLLDKLRDALGVPVS